MRISKELRAYIADKVQNKIDHQYASSFSRLDSLIHDEDKEISTALEELTKEADEKLKAIVAKYSPHKMAEYEGGSSWHPYMVVSHYSYTDGSARKEKSELKAQSRREALHATTEIVATLELGGTKADLDRMLEEL